MPGHFDEFYAVRVQRLTPRAGDNPPSRDVYLAENDRFGPISRARSFASIEAAEAAIAAHPGHDRFRFSVEFCTRERRNETENDETTDFLQRLMDIPYPYRRTAYNWVRGRDVRKILLRDSEEVYERHRRHLLDFDIDITRNSPVVILKPKRELKINKYLKEDKNAPRRYFVSQAERPSHQQGPVGKPDSGDE